MELGIIGLPQAGKKTVFRLLTGTSPEGAPCKSGVRRGIAAVRDPRIDRLVDMYQPKRMRYAEFNIALPPDIERNATRAADWLDPIRNVDALLQVVRAFESDSVFHVDGSVNPARDVDAVETELLFADLDLVEKRLSRMHKETVKRGDAAHQREQAALERFREHLEGEQSLRTLDISPTECEATQHLQFLTLKPMVVVLNTGEDLAEATRVLEPLIAELHTRGATTVCLSGAIESELLELDAEEQNQFMEEIGIQEPAAHRLSRAAYECLGLISYFTVGDDEVRAWPVREGARAPEAAGRIHSDLERGFIRAETIAYDDLIGAGSEREAKAAKLYQLNGKDYVVKDGDIMNFRFNV